MKESDRSRNGSDEEGTSPGATGGRERTRRGQGEELKEVMKIRRSRKGADDMRMRRSTRKTGALILDLVTLTPAGVPLPAYYTRLRTHTVAGERSATQRSAERTLRAARRLSHVLAQRISDVHVTIAHQQPRARMQNAREMDALTRLLRATR